MLQRDKKLKNTSLKWRLIGNSAENQVIFNIVPKIFEDLSQEKKLKSLESHFDNKNINITKFV